MAKAKEPAVKKLAQAPGDEDAATLAAIEEGIADAASGRTVPTKEVRKLLPKWISASSSRKER